jgi:imidazole glycerol-phosphate synthase subunit HisF
MLSVRVIPCLLLKGESLVKTIKFNKLNYIGDAINTVRIFNQMEVDELIFLDINASKTGSPPNFKLLEDIANECFMPFTYGGGIRNAEDINTIHKIGIEKVALNNYALENPEFIKVASYLFGSQSVIVSVDIKKNLLGKHEIYYRGNQKIKKYEPLEFIRLAQELGAGEILLNSVDRDGTWTGYDVDFIKKIAKVISIPLIACGGAGKIDDFYIAVSEGGASAVAAGSMFVFQGKDLGVLVNYPSRKELENVLNFNNKNNTI